MKLNYSIGTDQEIERIHEESLKILSEVGVVFHCEEAIDIFRNYGAKVENDIVYIDKKMVDEALASVPRTFDWYGRDGDKITVGDGKTKNVPAYGPIYVLKEGRYEKANHEHLVNFHKLHETSKIMDVSNPNVIDVSYIPPDIREKYRLGVALEYCTKPMMGLVEGKEVAEESLEMMRRFYGVERLSDKIIAAGLIDTMGPMRLSTSMAEALITYSCSGQALIICSGQTLGITAPQSMAGTFILGNAMILASIVLSQIVRPGTPVVYCGKFDSADMRLSSGAAYGGIESLWSAATSARMARYYNVPLHTGAGNTDSKLMDYQAGAETFMNLFSAYALDTDCLVHACGTLDSFNSIGYEKYILDEEKIESLEHLKQGYEVNEKTVMFDSIKKTGPSGQHFERTQKSYRTDFIMPKLSIRDNHNSWIQAGCPSAESLATEVWKKRLDEYVKPDFNKEQRSILEDLLPEKYR